MTPTLEGERERYVIKVQDEINERETKERGKRAEERGSREKEREREGWGEKRDMLYIPW